MRARLVMVERVKVNLAGDEMDIPVHASAPSCATCRWAEANDRLTPRLVCTRTEQPDTKADCVLMAMDSPVLGNAANLVVAPDFGCVSWEGK